MDLDNLLLEYKSIENLKITEKQFEYVSKLIDEIKEDNIRFKYDINMIKDLQPKEIFLIIEELKKIVHANMHYLTLIYKRFTHKDISKLLKKDGYITQKDAELILRGPEKFKPWIREHPLRSEEHWEYGLQESGLFEDGMMKYLKFYDMMMLDYDDFTYDELITHLKRFPFRFRIYKTYGGFHVFIISQVIPYNDEMTLELAKDLLSDIHYSLFSNKTGYKVRLSKKKNRSEEFIANYICEVGDSPSDELCEYLIGVHDQFIKMLDT